MDTKLYTWQHLLFTADILVQKGCLDEIQLALIIDMVDLKKLVKNNKLSKEFIDKYVIPRIDYDDYDGIDEYDIERDSHREKLEKELQIAFMKFEADYILENANKMGVPLGLIRNMKEVFEMQLANEMILEEEIEGVQTKRLKSLIFKYLK